ncbi:DUF2929 domain-containing protein [Virgibacillus profundi]|uniref:DUF2929 domain-containing protein n=1 Tax=Virgibacillus profundi TaxID=2024555 RepID=A0A2A2IC57_9BACI|nr:DUF2929 family protein [Virgibacillus profundi]PAV29207.1 DUF2929 domain-containing protein [Virgibacillus profundi]PXY53376.1 DUF2929 domain-containing protein [Virgibacillus profundi]
MRYIVTIIWAVLISAVISYVLASMAGNEFSMMGTFVVTGLFIVAVAILGDGILKEEKSNS